jgi:hypothetical protein
MTAEVQTTLAPILSSSALVTAVMLRVHPRSLVQREYIASCAGAPSSTAATTTPDQQPQPRTTRHAGSACHGDRSSARSVRTGLESCLQAMAIIWASAFANANIWPATAASVPRC